MFEVIIPVKNRSEIEQCVRSLIPPENPDRNGIERVIICDGGSRDRDYLIVLKNLEQWEKVEIFSHPIPQFNKSRLINQGILHSRAKYLLISDADIIWNGVTLKDLLDRVKIQENAIAYVENVQESDPDAEVLQRDRYTYEVQIKDRIASVKIVLEKAKNIKNRPGCGLICTRKRTLMSLGGYKEIFQGWGWEDRDLLLRGELLGFEICWTGTVTHLSHSDSLRDRGKQDSLIRSRNYNIIASFRSLKKSLYGNLDGCEKRTSPYQRIAIVQIPKPLLVAFRKLGLI
ncbi:MAG: glycosyltransferase family 2 protein [Cyanobacteria bacterium SBLK]|nr:glycosyltransferase family 2 protein [Cyanobacteria bacterium SBLK]